jgi:acetyl-CoA carboxylase, biotin carboxylase subunit
VSIKSILIANRGEIAVRIIKAAKSLGIKTILAHSEIDTDSLAARSADEKINIGSPIASKSYLNIDVVLSAALDSQADAVHPGYGFLSENADFAKAVTDAGMIFIGPDHNSIRLLGNKIRARQFADDIGIPTLPGSYEPIHDLVAACEMAQNIGFPVMIKASAGGGGRGIRVANNVEEFNNYYPQAALEAGAAFGDDSLYLEKYVQHARHIEVQILGDGNNFIHCFERDCSLQRRRQKIWEEGPAVGLDSATRESLCDSAVTLARAVKYCGAGTVEYLFDYKAKKFYFIEVNTRIQVEHPITEMITGIDLVKEMINIADGKGLSIIQEAVNIEGHAIECRINAEDPFNDFLPCPGEVSTLQVPKAENIRFDTLLYDGYHVPPYYDSLLGKLIVWNSDRVSCLSTLKKALSELKISGIPTTIPLHLALASDDKIMQGDFDIHYLEKNLVNILSGANIKMKVTT